MPLKGQKVLVVGLAKSGVSTLEALKKIGAIVTINDIKTEEALADLLKQIEGLYDSKLLACHPESFDAYDLMVLSPGVPTDLPFVCNAKASGLEVIGELELAYRLNSTCKYIGITGTNGKTTTTTWVGEIFKAAEKDTRVVGNIGLPVVSQVFDATEETVMVTEVSSFQLETIQSFKVQIAAILNLTPDHLNRHKTMENYIDAKARIFENQGPMDALILNYDNAMCLELANKSKGRVFYFSRQTEVEQGIYLDQSGMLQVKLNGENFPLVAAEEIFLPGDHNLENAMAAALIGLLGGVSEEVVKSVLKSFRGVAHRIEFVDVVHGVTYYNDSKGTNPDASIQAVKAMKQPTVLIAGGMDKGSTFETLIEAFNENIRHLVLFGETKMLIAKTAESLGFKQVTLVNNMAEAVSFSASIAENGWNVLLSPACASWDMYPSFEVRGEDFKNCVKSL